MKINLIIFISEFNLGGAGNSLFRLCRNLSKKIYNINVICINQCSYEKELKKENIKIFKIKSKKTSMAMLEIRKITKKLISKKYKKNIFISNIYYSNILSILFLKSLKMKMILIERTPFQELKIYFNFKDFIKKNIIKFLIGLTYKHADVCISNSKYISSEYNKRYQLSFKTIYPPSFAEKLDFKKKNNKINKSFVIGTVCRLSKEKGLAELLKTISKLRFNLKLIIIGNGPEKKILEKISRNLDIEKNIIFLGYLDYRNIKIELKKFDLFINSSYFEGFPNSVVEALANGVPVIASQSYGGINEIINNKNFGCIYKNEDVLIKSLSSFYYNRNKYHLDKKQINAHLNNFSISENIKKYSKVFQNI